MEMCALLIPPDGTLYVNEKQREASSPPLPKPTRFVGQFQLVLGIVVDGVDHHPIANHKGTAF